jgi:hypothetical protein
MASMNKGDKAYVRCVTITNSDTVSIATGLTDGILVLTAGNLVLVDTAGNVTTATVTAGQFLPLGVVRINATSSTGTAAALYYV